MIDEIPTLETERLVLRRLCLDDAQDMFDYASDPEVARYVPWDYHTSIEDSIDYLRSVEEKYESGETLDWGIVYKQNSRLIGSCGYPVWNKRNHWAEVGYVVSREYWNKGIVSEALKEIVTFGFENMDLNLIYASCMVENLASERVMLKMGMKFEGILRERLLVEGAYHDVKIYSLLREERR